MVPPTELANLLRSAFTQADRLLRLETPLGPNALLPERLDAAEHLDEGGFRLELTALSDDADLDPARLLGQPVRLDLLTQLSRSTLRPFHGHVTRFEQLGANGGLVRYRLVVEPWLAFLRHRRDSFLFQDMSVIEVIDSLFGDYNGQGRLTPAWRWSLHDTSVYTRRSVITQYEESDFDFASRLLAEEGLFYFFEHEVVQGRGAGRAPHGDRRCQRRVRRQRAGCHPLRSRRCHRQRRRDRPLAGRTALADQRRVGRQLGLPRQRQAQRPARRAAARRRSAVDAAGHRLPRPVRV
ncbi:VgrG protein (plasmid) [Ralstonia solanacearum Po82]|uniref:VgrG protein n=1 Tax=Ralstonia solanacearum (strain Po82) TaxID=1031711 RepID=F6G9C6_RALS8|nr:VgrG protein [Ralstonia solanacearum Po82]